MSIHIQDCSMTWVFLEISAASTNLSSKQYIIGSISTGSLRGERSELKGTSCAPRELRCSTTIKMSLIGILLMILTLMVKISKLGS